MPVKSKTSLFRDLLYLQEVISQRQICSAAAKNGIKASNLSKIIRSVEESTGKKLFIRTSHGLYPNERALKIAALIKEMEKHFDQIADKICQESGNMEVKLFLTPNLELKNLNEYIQNHPALKVKLCHSELESDVSVVYSAPKAIKNRTVVENKVGHNFSQSIWVTCENNEQALNLAHFIIQELHKG